MQGQTNMSPGASGMLLSFNPLKQCRSNSDMDVDSRDDRRGPMKLARTDSFINSQQTDLKMQMSSSGTLGSLVRSNSMVSDGRLGCSPTNSTASDAALLGNESNLMSESRIARNDSVLPAYVGANARSLYHHPAYSLQPSGLPLSMSREVSNMGMHEADRGKLLFTSNQLRELQHQALVMKYIASGVNVPPELLNPIRNSVTLSSVSASSHHLTSLPWGGYHLGFSSNTDPEPGRCRRTDGKKWRCSRDVVPDQKYCERHMHRGRNRSRKPPENQTSSSQAVSIATVSSSGASSVSVTAARGPTGSSGILPSISANTQHSRPISNLGIKPYAAVSGSGGLSVGSSIRGSQFQVPLHSSTATALSTKDFRYLNGITKSELDLGPEQMFFAEATGSTRGISQDFHAMNRMSMLTSASNSWRSMSPNAPPAPEPKTNSSSILQYNNSPQIRSMLAQDFGVLSDSNSVNMSMTQQQHSFLGGGFGPVEGVSVGREPEGQPLRHFFDDWPRSRDPSTLSWSDVDDERSNRSSSTTQLSISIPLASSDFTSTGTTSPRGKLSLSPLKLSMARAGEDDPLGVDATQMGLGVGMGLGISEDRHRQTNWIPIAWETPVGGPLAEVLQSSTPRGCKSSGLNLMTDGWESSPRDSPRMASPTDTDSVGRVARSGVAALEPSESMD